MTLRSSGVFRRSITDGLVRSAFLLLFSRLACKVFGCVEFELISIYYLGCSQMSSYESLSILV